MYEEKKCTHYTINKNVFWIGAIVILLLIAAMLFEIYRLSDSAQTGTTPERVEKTHIEFGSIESKLKDTDKCYLCGLAPESLMGYYRKFDTVGVIGLNQWVVMDLRLKEYDSEGNCVEKEGSSSAHNSMQGVEYTIESTPSRGKASATIKSTDGMFYESTVKKHLCQQCLDKVVSTLQRDTVDGAKDFLPFCVVDFETLELYPVQREQHSYFVRDYWVQIESIDEEIELEVFYLPEK